MIPFLNSLRNTPLTKPVFSKLRKRRRTRFTCVTRPRGSYLLFFSPFDWGNNPEVHGGHMQLKLLTCSLWKASSCLTATLPRTSGTEWLGVVVRLDAELRDGLYGVSLLSAQCSPTSPASRTPSIRTSHWVMFGLHIPCLSCSRSVDGDAHEVRIALPNHRPAQNLQYQ